MSGTPTPAAPTEPAPTPPPKSRAALGAGVAAVVVVLIVVVASLYIFKVGPFATSSNASPEEAGFTQGQVVTFVYTGNYECTPSLLSFFPSANAASQKTSCEVGAASQNAVNQVPEWVLVPAFAGLSIFGVTALGASSRGFPTVGGAALLTDCGAGASPTACPDHPDYLYSPAFSAVEQFINQSSGYGGLPLGVLPTPAHDHLLNTSTTFGNIEWGTIAVLVLDPNILPDRTTGACHASVASNLSSPTANCLTSIDALDRALTTESSAVATANGGSPGNPIWKALGGPRTQVVVPGDLTIGEINNLNANLYIPFSVQPGAPPSFPT